MKKVERRFLAQEIRIAGGDKPKISGYASVFNSLSEDLGFFREEVDPNAFDAVMGANPDVRALFNHDSNIVLGRTTAGTLRLSVDARGLAYEIDPPDTQMARDLMVSMKRGDITQSSYGFIVARDQWTDNPDGSITRRVLEIEELLDVSPVTYPAYTSTAAQARDLPASMPAELRSRVIGTRAYRKAAADAESTGGPERPILEWPLDQDGYFAAPTAQLTAEQEVHFGIVRQSAVAFADYADSTCGDPATLDPKEAYLCGGTAPGLVDSKPCNKFVILGSECLIRKTVVIDLPHSSSCSKWDIKRAGDIEVKRCPQGRYDDATIRFGITTNPLGWSCRRCKFGELAMPFPDSQGRDHWCKWHGMPIEQKACCGDNEQDTDGDGSRALRGEQPGDAAGEESAEAFRERVSLRLRLTGN
jgi:HK97 family phage prohead protease